MAPFSFEHIARSAGVDPSNAFPVSDAARATHESFESHLQRAAASTSDQSTRQPARKDEPREKSESSSDQPSPNETVRQDTGETRRSDADIRPSDTAETTAATETSTARNEEGAQQDAAPEDEALAATVAEAPRAAIQDGELPVAGDSDDNPEKVAVNKLTATALESEESACDTSLAKQAEEPADGDISQSGDDASAAGKVDRAGSASVQSVNSATGTQRVNPAETNDEVAGGEFHKEAQAGAAASQDVEPSKASTTQQRRGQRGDIVANQATHNATAAATTLVAVDSAKAAADTGGDDRARQQESRQDTDGTRSIGKAGAAEVTTTTPGAPSRFAQHLLTRTEDPNGRGLSITNADQARFVERVARAVQATGERGGTLRLRLSPPELGALTLVVKVQGGVVSARVEAESPAARSLLLENLPLLRERLAEHGMQVDQFDVDLSDRHAGGTPDGLQQHDQQHEERPRSKATSPESEVPPASLSDTLTKHGNEQLNIIV